MATNKKVLARAIEKLKINITQTPRLDAEILLAHALNKSREWILTHPRYMLSEKIHSDFQKLINRRCKNEPVAYIIGHKEFFGFDFEVNESTLIPRPETELLVQQAIDYVRNFERSSKQNKNIILIDVGTGSGNIIISLAIKLREDISISNPQNKRWLKNKFIFFALDISIDALKIAKQNAQNNGVDENITFLSGRFLNPLIQNSELLSKAGPTSEGSSERTKLLVIANLPYLSQEIYDSTSASIKLYEPKNALLSGLDGLDHYRKLLNQIKTLVEFYGLSVAVFLEISPEQKTLITKEIKVHFPKVKMNFVPDLANKNRVVIFEV